ncbi:hypothetical protein MMC31_004207 [Peltigera leucophlebia]|nr:hypothetical protein [Peltigera leucophlebia]
MRQESPFGLFPTSLIFLGCALTVATLPELHPRQDCDTTICPDPSWFTGVGDKVLDTWQSIGGYLDGVLFKNPPEQQIPTIPTAPLLPGSLEITPENPHGTEWTPQNQPSSGTENCPVGAPELNYDSNDQNQNFRQCSAAPAQIIMPKDCTSPKNAMVAQKLAVIDSSFKTSRSPRCPGENGVVFWLAHLTADQAAMILTETDGAVEGIAPDSPFESDPLTPAPELMVGEEVIPETTKVGNRLRKKRGNLQVEVREWNSLFDSSLTFLSTPPGRTNLNSRKYSYFKTAVEYARRHDIRVYLVDSGYARGGQIRNDRLEWLYGIGVEREESDSDPNGHGTCMASKIGSPACGVVPWGPVFTIVKILPTVASFIDSLGSILGDVIEKASALQGRAVIQMTGNWPLRRDEAFIIRAMQEGINALLSSKIMVVSPAARGRPGEQMATWPSSLAGMTDMITVGAVTPYPEPGIPYGSRYSWSLTGPPGTVTVSAPGGGLCRTPDGSLQSFIGADMPAAVTTGLVAYFLAIPDLQEYFNAQPNWASAVKRYVMAMSYPRNELVTSVWNGLDSADAPTKTYNTPGDPWIGIPYPGNPRFG